MGETSIGETSIENPCESLSHIYFACKTNHKLISSTSTTTTLSSSSTESQCAQKLKPSGDRANRNRYRDRSIELDSGLDFRARPPEKTQLIELRLFRGSSPEIEPRRSSSTSIEIDISISSSICLSIWQPSLYIGGTRLQAGTVPLGLLGQPAACGLLPGMLLV